MQSDSDQQGPLLPCTLMKSNRITPKCRLWEYTVWFAAETWCVCVHVSIEMYLPCADREACCCLPVTNGRLKRAVVHEKWKHPFSSIYNAHTPMHTAFYTNDDLWLKMCAHTYICTLEEWKWHMVSVLRYRRRKCIWSNTGTLLCVKRCLRFCEEDTPQN